MDNTVLQYHRNVRDNKVKKYKFSVIMAVYNVEEYIEEAMQSILDQTIGFEHIQVIMVDDCSTDNSASICERYAALYPENVVFVRKQSNTGAADTRNAAIDHICGVLTTSVDPDDRIDLALFEKVYEYYGQVSDQVDVITVPMHFFEAQQGYHISSRYDYDTTKVVDIEKEWYGIKLSVCGAFIKSEVFRKYRYPVSLTADCEDTYLITEIILEKKKYAVLSGYEYHYRKRNVKNSLTQTNGDKKEWYIDKIRDFQLKLIAFSRKEYGSVLRYIQFLCIYILQWSIRYNYGNARVLSKDETDLYLELVHEMLQDIDDDIIVNQIGDRKLGLNIHTINFLLKLKYGKDVSVYEYDEGSLYKTIGGHRIYSIRDHGIHVSVVEIRNRNLHIAGYYTDPFEGAGLRLKVYMAGEPIEFVRYESETFKPKYFGSEASKCYEFVCDISLCQYLHGGREEKLYFVLENEHIRHKMAINLNRFPYCKLYPPNKCSYYIKEHIGLSAMNDGLRIKRAGFGTQVAKEIALLSVFLFGSRLLDKRRSNIKAAVLRVLYWMTYPMYHGGWLFMDRADKGGDNAEFLFRYSVRQPDGQKKYFVVNKNTKTYRDMKREHLPVVSQSSLKHRLLFLHADKFITSQMDIIHMNDMRGIEVFFRDLISFDYVHVQHGICWQNLDHLLNANLENLKLMTSCSYAEYNNMSQKRYGYVNGQLRKGGMARFDGFAQRDQEKEQIVICPTWRKELVGRLALDGKREYSTKYKESLFFRVYNDLLSDHKFVDEIEACGYKLLFLLHPNMQTQREDYSIDQRVVFPDRNEVDYDRSLRESKIMVTDYSGIQFDFAYMRKPVIYFHHKDLPNHLENSEFFQYERDGFGEICRDVGALKQEIFKTIRNEGKMAPEYVERVRRFFIYDDFDHCRRIYEEIVKM